MVVLNNVRKGVAWSEWPVCVPNKGFALSTLLFLMIYAIQRRRSQAEPAGRLLPVAFLSGFHAMLLGDAGWFQPSTWPGHMIPFTLISFVAGSVAAAAAFWPQRKLQHFWSFLFPAPVFPWGSGWPGVSPLS